MDKEDLRKLFDLIVGSMDFGSGFFDQEDIDVVRKLAEEIGVCPNAGTPQEMMAKYPDCGFLTAPYESLPDYRFHEDHSEKG